MKSKYISSFYSNLLLVCIFSILLSMIIGLTESFLYSGFFLKHFGLSPNLFFYVAIVSSIIISIFPVNNSAKNKKWIKGIEKLFSVDIGVFIFLLLFTLIMNGIESVTYGNFVFDKIHVQPFLLYRPLIVQSVSLFMILSLVIRSAGNREGSILIKRIGFVKNVKAADFRNYILIIYSLIVMVFTMINVINFVIKFYQPDKAFPDNNDLKYALGKINVYQWVGTYFPKTQGIVKWCDQQEKHVDLITLDSEIIWMNYEGLSRVFLTNCRYVNINTLRSTYDYLNKNNLMLVSVSSCDPNLKDNKPDPKIKTIDYFKVLNNGYICNSKEIVPGLYMYKGNVGEKSD